MVHSFSVLSKDIVEGGQMTRVRRLLFERFIVWTAQNLVVLYYEWCERELVPQSRGRMRVCTTVSILLFQSCDQDQRVMIVQTSPQTLTLTGNRLRTLAPRIL